MLSFILGALAIRLFDDFNFFVILVFILPVVVAFIFVDRAVFNKNRYLKYFEEFEKEDERWHKKWSRITTAFCIGAVMMTITGIAAMWAVWLW